MYAWDIHTRVHLEERSGFEGHTQVFDGHPVAKAMSWASTSNKVQTYTGQSSGLGIWVVPEGDQRLDTGHG